MTDICKVLSHFRLISLSNNSLKNTDISSGNFPEPALFFTWYCEKAREIEKHTGSVESSLQLLDLALENLPSNSRIAKRFILATKNSLLRYKIHINSLASKLEQENTSLEEKASILQTLRSIDLKEFEMSGRKPDTDSSSLVIHENKEKFTENDNEVSPEDLNNEFSFNDWLIEIRIIDLILKSQFNEAFIQAQQFLFFPTAVLDKYSLNPTEWLEQYCRALSIECEVYLNRLQKNSCQPISAELCNDYWSQVISEHLGISMTSATEEQTMCLISAKSKMALSVLKLSCKSKNKIEEDYF